MTRTVQQIADILSVPRSTVYGHLDKASVGLPPLSVPLFPEGLVQAAIENHATGGRQPTDVDDLDSG